MSTGYIMPTNCKKLRVFVSYNGCFDRVRDGLDGKSGQGYGQCFFDSPRGHGDNFAGSIMEFKFSASTQMIFRATDVLVFKYSLGY
ncbi:hypothetical protein PC128_g24454 [Phytophthora cactorum]|nr:hypothetical protein PC128_g24454 [Phytophthora cactorum]